MINNNCPIGDKGGYASWPQPSAQRLPDVGVLARPGSEGLQLALWLAHPSVEKVELAK